MRLAHRRASGRRAPASDPPVRSLPSLLDIKQEIADSCAQQAPPESVWRVKCEIAEHNYGAPLPSDTRRDIMEDIATCDEEIQFTPAYTDDIVRAQVNHHKDTVMASQFAPPPTAVSATAHVARSTRTDKKRKKRLLIDRDECSTSQAMQVIPPPPIVRVGSDFLYRAPDIDVIGDVTEMDVVDTGGSVALVSGGSSSRPLASRDAHVRDVEQSLSLSLQEYYMKHSATADAETDPNAICQRHLQAMHGQTGQFSFVINMAMNDRAGGASIPLDMLPNIDAIFASVRDISREEEERFLRPPIPQSGERKCIKEDECEGFYIWGAMHKFALVEYQPPEVREQFARTGTWSEVQGMCIMCRRKYANFVYFNIVARCMPHDYSSVEQAMEVRQNAENAKPHKPLMIASFANRVGVGEYALYDVILGDLAQCVPLFKPIVIHRRDKYRQVYKNGQWQFEQTYHRPERNLWDGDDQEFAAASSSTANEQRRSVRP